MPFHVLKLIWKQWTVVAKTWNGEVFLTKAIHPTIPLHHTNAAVSTVELVGECKNSTQTWSLLSQRSGIGKTLGLQLLVPNELPVTRVDIVRKRKNVCMVCVCVHMHACMCVCIYACAYVCVCVCVCKHTCACLLVGTCTHIWVHACLSVCNAHIYAYFPQTTLLAWVLHCPNMPSTTLLV